MRPHNLLTDPLPEQLEVGGKMYPIRSDFRTAIRLEEIVRDKRMDEGLKLMQMLLLFFGSNIPEDIPGAVDAVLCFYQGGRDTGMEQEKKKEHNRKKRRGSQGKENRQLYSFCQDSSYLYASFMEQYGISLRDAQLHWWEFLALFEGLGEHTRMGKVLYYRSVNTAGMPKEKRKHINEMKKLYALKEPCTVHGDISLGRRNAGWLAYVRSRMEAMKER